MISYVNSFPGIQTWLHDILHSTEFTHEFMIMNSYMISLSWIQRWFHTWILTWFHDILHWHHQWHDHEFISEFIHEFMYMKNIVKSHLKSCVPRFQMATYLTGAASYCSYRSLLPSKSVNADAFLHQGHQWMLQVVAGPCFKSTRALKPHHIACPVHTSASLHQ